MICRLSDLRHKEVINLKDGTRLGCVSDVEIDTKTSRLSAIIVYGKMRFWGLFGREDDSVIRWEDIQIIGDDTILVRYDVPCKRHRRSILSGIFTED